MWMLIAIVLVIIIAVGVLAFAPRTAKKVILAMIEEDREFVKRKKFVKHSEE